MATTLKSDGQVVHVTAPTGGYTSGQVIELVDMIGVVHDATTAGDTAVVHTEGVWALTKVGHAAGAFTPGDSVYRTSTGNLINTATGNQYAGKAWNTVATNATSVNVKINWGPGNSLV